MHALTRYTVPQLENLFLTAETTLDALRLTDRPVTMKYLDEITEELYVRSCNTPRSDRQRKLRGKSEMYSRRMRAHWLIQQLNVNAAAQHKPFHQHIESEVAA